MGWIAVAILGVNVSGQLCVAGDFFGVGAVLDVMQESLALSDREAGLIQGAFGITYGLGLFFRAPVGHRVSTRRLFAMGLAGSGAMMTAQSFATSFISLFAIRLVAGFFDAAVWVGSMKLVMEWFPRARQGLATGVTLAA